MVKNLPANVGDIRDVSLIPGLGRSPGGGHGSPLQYSCLENPMDRRAWWATVQRVPKSWTRLKWLSTLTHTLHVGKGSVCFSVHHCVYPQPTWDSKVFVEMNEWVNVGKLPFSSLVIWAFVQQILTGYPCFPVYTGTWESENPLLLDSIETTVTQS